MLEQSGILEYTAREAAAYAVNRCALGLLPVDMVAARVRDEWLAQARSREEPSDKLLRRMALRYCSRRLYLSCCSLHAEERDCAFQNLRRYLQDSLSRSIYVHSLTADVAEDVLQQTLTHLHRLFTQQPPAGPDDPAAFLKWTHTILLHNAHTFVEQAKHDISLEAQTEAYLEQNTLDERSDQIEEIYTRELQRLLRHAILSLKNPRYRLVLAGLFLAGMEESELASAMGVQIQDIYLWRHRALKALRSNRELLETLRAWLR